jgi:hypothetical protein
MTIKNLPKKFIPLWKKVLPLLEKGRPGDVDHIAELLNYILDNHKKLKINLNVFIPLAMLHDIGHSAILSEHFSYITGFNKVPNGKLVHMLTGAKIADDLLSAIRYNDKLKQEIIDIISIHDFDQLSGFDTRRFFNSRNKKIFHDIDALDWYNVRRVANALKNNRDPKMLAKYFKGAEEHLKSFFSPAFKKIATARLKEMKKKLV